jgi:hypothetical protein
MKELLMLNHTLMKYPIFLNLAPSEERFGYFMQYGAIPHTPWPESASELYRLSDHRLSSKLMPTFADRRCHVVSVMDPYGRILGFLDRSRYFFLQIAHSCTHEAEWTPFYT